MKIQAVLMALALCSAAPVAMADDVPIETRNGCEAKANAKKLKGDARKAAIDACIAEGISSLTTKGNAEVPVEKKMACDDQANAKKLKGDERKAFVDKCTSTGVGGMSSDAAVPIEKTNACNDEANKRKLKGEERKGFISGCQINNKL